MLSSSLVAAPASRLAERAADVLTRLDAWLQTMRAPGGYAGPISHWWESCLLYCGPMIDWRYEGLLSAYVTLAEHGGSPLWLARARAAADDVLAGQLPGGTFRNSSFQYGPIEGGTPHEAAVDVGLLELARLLRAAGDPDWQRYLAAAERNIRQYLLGMLWSPAGFMEQPWDKTPVPNKNATAMEALLLFEELTGQEMSCYIEAALRVILGAQLRGGPRDGATVHLGTGRWQLAIGIYTARSMAAVLRYCERHARPELLDAAARAIAFLNRQLTSRGAIFGHYRDGRPITNPRWIAPSGDILRVAVMGARYGLTPPSMIEALVDLLAAGQLPSGGISTAYGFAHRGSERPYTGLPDFRDLLPVVGWCDKALRGLALVAAPARPAPGAITGDVTRPCTWKGRRCVFYEDAATIGLEQANGRTLYRWAKGQTWPEIYAL